MTILELREVHRVHGSGPTAVPSSTCLTDGATGPPVRG